MSTPSVHRTNVIPTLSVANTFTTSLITVAPSFPKWRSVGALPPVSVGVGFIMSDPASGRQAQVDQSFAIVLSLIDEGFLATSSIADLYEIGETVREAVGRYFASLVDELLWFQGKGENLSDHLMKVDRILQSYIHLV